MTKFSPHSIRVISIAVTVFIAGSILLWGYDGHQFPSLYPTVPAYPPYPVVNSTTPYPTFSDLPTPTPFYDIKVRSPKPVPVSFGVVAWPTPSPVAMIDQPGIFWLSEPLEMTKDPGVFKVDSMYHLGDGTVTMYKVGTQNGKDLFYVIISEMGQSVFLFRNDGDRLALIDDGNNYGLENYSSKVYVDSSTTFQALKWPQKLSLYGIPFITGYGNPFSGLFFEKSVKGVERTLFANTPYGPMYLDREPMTSDHPVEAQIFELRGVDGESVTYDLKYSFFKDDGTPQITWSDGGVNKSGYETGHSGGCGMGNPEIVPFSSADGTLFQVGTTSAGEAVYDFVDPLDSIEKHFYNRTNGAVYNYDSTTGETYSLFPLSEFVKNHGVFIYRDRLGCFVIFHNTTYGPQAECGKPVIYLYPTKPTQVHVEVGARITKSEPIYNHGWDVLAEPTGKQTLFWEGLGNGPYPEITQGFVVKQADLESTLRSQMAQLGLNARESQDFLDFWLPKMPTTPYVRLTWFGTRQMDALAPLYVTPKPDTVIRIFLDFEGLQAPISIAPQQLSSIPRTGFTVVEWGGLLRR